MCDLVTRQAQTHKYTFKHSSELPGEVSGDEETDALSSLKLLFDARLRAVRLAGSLRPRAPGREAQVCPWGRTGLLPPRPGRRWRHLGCVPHIALRSPEGIGVWARARLSASILRAGSAGTAGATPAPRPLPGPSWPVALRASPVLSPAFEPHPGRAAALGGNQMGVLRESWACCRKRGAM